MRERIMGIVFMFSAVAVLFAAAVYLQGWAITPYIFASGAAGIAVTRLTTRYKGTDLRIKRLHVMETFSALLIVVASSFMFSGEHWWLVLLLIAAILQLYASFVLGRIKEK